VVRSQGRRVTIRSLAAHGRSDRLVARRPFSTPDALVVVSTGGYFDVFAPVDRRPNARPTYRGVIAELGPTVRDATGMLSVRPDSVVLEDAVSVWSSVHGAAAVRGELGGGRQAVVAPPAAKPAAKKAADPEAGTAAKPAAGKAANPAAGKAANPAATAN
jgi:hypothetical protein